MTQCKINYSANLIYFYDDTQKYVRHQRLNYLDSLNYFYETKVNTGSLKTMIRTMEGCGFESPNFTIHRSTFESDLKFIEEITNLVQIDELQTLTILPKVRLGNTSCLC